MQRQKRTRSETGNKTAPESLYSDCTYTLHAKLLENWMMRLNKGIRKIRKLDTLSDPNFQHSKVPQHHENFPSESCYNKVHQSKAPSMGRVARELFILTVLKINN